MRAIDAFRRALVAAVRADSGFNAQAAQRFYSEAPGDRRADDGGAPNNVASPYAWIGPIGWTRVEASCAPDGFALRVRLYAATTGPSRREAQSLAAALYAALDGRFLDLADDCAQGEAIRAYSGGDIVDPIDPKIAYFDFTAIVYG